MGGSIALKHPEVEDGALLIALLRGPFTELSGR